MVTVDEIPKLKQGGKYECSFKGLSTDEKPTVKYNGLPIANGSTFIEMNTKSLKYYDEANATWV